MTILSFITYSKAFFIINMLLIYSLGIFGHSMGGHGALTLALRNKHLFKYDMIIFAYHALINFYFYFPSFYYMIGVYPLLHRSATQAKLLSATKYLKVYKLISINIHPYGNFYLSTMVYFLLIF